MFTVTPKIIKLANRGNPISPRNNRIASGFDNRPISWKALDHQEIKHYCYKYLSQSRHTEPTILPMHGTNHVPGHVDSLGHSVKESVVFIVQGHPSIRFVGEYRERILDIPCIAGRIIRFDHNRVHGIHNPNELPWSLLSAA